MASQRTTRKGIYQSTTLLAVVLLLLIVFVSAAYVILLPAPDPLAEQKLLLEDLKANREKWGDRQPLSYRYVVDRSCFCARESLEPYVAFEQRGSKTAVFPVPFESEAGEVLTAPPYPMWIDDLLALIEQSALDGDVVFVDYDASYGYPKLVDIRREAADAFVRYELRDFEVTEYR